MKKIALPLLGLLMSTSVSAQFDLESNLSDAEKLYGLSKFWSEATYNFAFFDQTDVNWDSAYQAFIPRVLATPNTFEYYRELKRFCALLQDGHTDVYAPESLYQSSFFIRLIFMRMGDKIIVKNVAKVDADKVPVGSELLTVDGLPAKVYFETSVLPYISGSTEHERWNDALRSFTYPLRDTLQSQAMVFLTPSGEKVTYHHRCHNANTTFVHDFGEWKRFDFEMLPDDVAHVTINTFGDSEVVGDFVAKLPELKAASAVILDLRGNGGGNSDVGAEILQYFTDQNLLGSVWRTRQHRPAYKAWGDWLLTEDITNLDEWPEDEQEWYHTSVNTALGESWYIGDTMHFVNQFETAQITSPLIILISNYTASAAEDFLIFADGLGDRATVIGQRSFGSTGQPMQFDLPGGGSARICTKRDSYPDGREFVGFGVEPDIFIEPTINDLISGRDIELDRALEYLHQKK
ncbi:MAG: hypothetical protein KDC34_18935 [Saprospiraceae bacterium]|nr:hypothetical protein [Saprospiraceae bacterium]